MRKSEINSVRGCHPMSFRHLKSMLSDAPATGYDQYSTKNMPKASCASTTSPTRALSGALPRHPRTFSSVARKKPPDQAALSASVAATIIQLPIPGKVETLTQKSAEYDAHIRNPRCINRRHIPRTQPLYHSCAGTFRSHRFTPTHVGKKKMPSRK